MEKPVSAVLLIVTVHHIDDIVGHGYMIYFHGGIRETLLVNLDDEPLPYNEWYHINVTQHIPTVWNDRIH